jgi:uncharacterized membrane protein
MPDQDNEDLQSRIDRLEKKVEKLERRLEQKSVSGPKRPESHQSDFTNREKAGQNTVEESGRSDWNSNNIQVGEQWLNRIGIGLLLIGVMFLFKYSIDQGWLIPPVRSAIGFGIGVFLSVVGLQIRAEVKPLKQILLGGGIAVFYITGFATFQLYSFMPSVVIWSFMVVVTLLSLSLSLQEDEAVLSVVGTLGALGTPFMLYTGEGSIVLLMVYTMLVLAAAIVIYMQKGWKSLLWSIWGGGALVIFVGLINTTYYEESATFREHWALQTGALVWTLGAWVLPVVRDQLTKHNLALWPDPKMKLEDGSIDRYLNFSPSSSVHLMAFLVPLLMLVMTVSLWELSMDQAGMVSITLGIAGSLFYLPLTRQGLPKLASTHVLLGLCMLTIGFILILEGNFLFIVIVVEAVALRFVAYQTQDVKISVSSHLLFGIAFLWVLNMLYSSIGIEVSAINLESATQLVVIVAGGVLVPRWLEESDLKQAYLIVSHVVFLLWLYQKCMVLGNGQAWVTVAWGAYAISLLVWGFIQYHKDIRLVGMGTIFLVVGKLFLVDLSQLEAIWRILLFMGFGAVFLLLGYYWQLKWNDNEQAELSND